MYNNEYSEMIETKARQVLDVSGAGDTVITTMALGIVSGMSINDAAKLANYAAGIVVGKRGTATATTKELTELLEKIA